MKNFVIILLIILISAVLYLNIPYSPVKRAFSKTLKKHMHKVDQKRKQMKKDALSEMPPLLQEHFTKREFIDKYGASMAKIEFKDVDFSLTEDKPSIKMDYTLYNFRNNTTRLALIDSSVYGIPFEGSEGFADGNGWMKGTLAKHFTLFNEVGEHMDKASLITYLAESIIHPGLMLNENITFSEHGENSIKAVIQDGDTKEEGIFYFYDDHKRVEFHAMRYNSDTKSNEKWVTILDDFKHTEEGYMPTTFRGIWRFDDRDFEYFKSTKITFEFR